MSSATEAPEPPTTIKRLPIEYDQKINSFLNDILYNASQAKAMCFVTDTMGKITANAKNTMLALKDAIIGGAEGSIVNDFITEGSDGETGFSNYAVLSDENVLEIYRPYYSRYKQIGMLKIVENFDLGPIVALSYDSTDEASSSTDEQWQTAWNDLIELCGNNQRGA
jgi:hypothetical protein